MLRNVSVEIPFRGFVQGFFWEEGGKKVGYTLFLPIALLGVQAQTHTLTGHYREYKGFVYVPPIFPSVKLSSGERLARNMRSTHRPHFPCNSCVRCLCVHLDTYTEGGQQDCLIPFCMKMLSMCWEESGPIKLISYSHVKNEATIHPW